MSVFMLLNCGTGRFAVVMLTRVLLNIRQLRRSTELLRLFWFLLIDAYRNTILELIAFRFNRAAWIRIGHMLLLSM